MLDRAEVERRMRGHANDLASACTCQPSDGGGRERLCVPCASEVTIALVREARLEQAEKIVGYISGCECVDCGDASYKESAEERDRLRREVEEKRDR